MMVTVRVGAVRAWLRGAVNTGAERARKVGHALSRRIKDAGLAIGRGVGVGDDESSFGGGRSAVWLEVVEEYKQKLLAFLEKSSFERFPRFEKFMRRILGGPAKPRELPQPNKRKGPVKLGAHTPPTNEEAARFRQQIQAGIMKANMQEHAGLRDGVERHRAENMVRAVDPDEGRQRREREQPEDEDQDQP